MENVSLNFFLREVLKFPQEIQVNSYSAAQVIQNISAEFEHQLKLYVNQEIQKT